MFHSEEAPVPEQLSDASRRRRQAHTQRRVEKFLKGPIPLWWMERAAVLPGKALIVGLVIWFWSGVTWPQKDIAVTDQRLQPFGVDRKARYRAIAALEEAGLIQVERRRGRCPRATLVTKSSTAG